MKRALKFLALFASLCPIGAVVRADLPPAANVKPPALADAEEKLEPGLTLTFTSGKITDSRPARLAALYVDENQSPTPFLPPGPFTATWTGNLTSRIRDTITLSAVGRGTLKVTVNDQPALETSGDDLAAKPGQPIQLKKGKNKLVIEYTAPAKGPAEVRLMWQGESFPAEPVPPTVFTHDTSDKSLREHIRIRDGRALFADLRCAKCHTPADKLPKTAMPELSMDAPSLADVGSRLNEGYIATWIENPKALRPQATMPRLFHGPDAAANAKDIAAYLATLGTKSTAPAPATDDASVVAGTRLFTSLGCIACHNPPDAEKVDPTRLPHNVIRAKWQPAALVEFLKHPERTYAWTRMPNFRLTDAEASHLAAYLLAKSPEQQLATGGDATRGAKLFTTSGCLNCHTAPGTNEAKGPSLADLLKSDWTKGCLATDDTARGHAPDFALSDDQRGELQAFAASDFNSLSRDNPIEVAERQFTLSNCSACHLRDNLGDTWTDLKEEAAKIESTLPPLAEDHGEKYAPDQSRPQLTWVGEKLKTDWAAKFIAGHIPYKPRPFIQARMPGFPARGALIAAGFANEHGYPAADPPDPAPDASLVAIGQKLVGKNGGFSCNACHAIADAPATAAFEAPAPNFAHVKDRLRHDYYVRWVRNPLRIDRGTRMPTFAGADGKTPVRDTLDGDADKQFNAIWQYLLQGPSVKPPQ